MMVVGVVVLEESRYSSIRKGLRKEEEEGCWWDGGKVVVVLFG